MTRRITKKKTSKKTSKKKLTTTKRKIKKVSKKYPKVLVILKKQSGKSNVKYDARLTALPPGKRISKTGKVYWETRKNRSDKKGKRI